jgi:hypothetical protein
VLPVGDRAGDDPGCAGETPDLAPGAGDTIPNAAANCRVFGCQWRNDRCHRLSEKFPTWDVIRKYKKD